MTARLSPSIPRSIRRPFGLTALASACLLASGCQTVENALSGDKVDYRSATVRQQSLDVPPDLTQLARDSRYQAPTGGSISAAAVTSPASSTAATPAATASATGAVAVTAVSVPQSSGPAGGMARIERAGTQRWLVVGQTPEQLWPKLQAFWKDRGFTLTVEQADLGILETDWAENRAKLPQGTIRNALGRVLGGLYSTGERDRFRTRIERTASGSEVFISHRGMVEVYSDVQRTQTVWQPRPADAELEAEFLLRLAGVLNGTAPVAGTRGTATPGADAAAVAAAARAPQASAAPAGPARARLVEDASQTRLLIDDGFDRAWRRVGLALDRSGFTVEDRDRSAGVYFVRFVPPREAPTADRGFFARLFSREPEAPSAQRMRIQVRGDGDGRSSVTVQDAQGAASTSDTARRIAGLLLDDLK
jgi:outer membrane protein assembly factor BamC